MDNVAMEFYDTHDVFHPCLYDPRRLAEMLSVWSLAPGTCLHALAAYIHVQDWVALLFDWIGEER